MNTKLKILTATIFAALALMPLILFTFIMKQNGILIGLIGIPSGIILALLILLILKRKKFFR